jgi:ABC-2 type transport system ATP-binding protein
MGYLPENHRFPRYLTGRQVIEFFGAMSKVDRVTRRRRAAELIEIVNMRDAADRKVGTYSKGMAQRIGLAQAMVNDPDLILLDEPTDGVDPVGRREIRDVLMQLRDRGKTVFINSHLLSELEMISDRVAILVAGRVASQGTIGDLTQARQHYQIEVANHGASSRPLPELFAATSHLIPPPQLPTVPGRPLPPPLPARSVARGSLASGILLEIEGPVIRAGTTDPAAIQPLLDTLRGARFVVQRVQLIRPSLEELFIETVGANGKTSR